jgi:hypothetical protein
MRVLKCYLANDREGHFVTAGEAMSAPGQIWSCASCGCRLVLHAGTFSDPRGLNTIRRPWPGMC